MEIEKVAEKTPEKILKVPFLLDGRIRAWHLLQIAEFMGWKDEIKKEGLKIVKKIAEVFCKTDAFRKTDGSFSLDDDSHL